MKLTHIGINNFRSIGAEFVTLDLTKKINVLVGANNCGKSNVLRAFAFLGSKAQDSTFVEIDRHHRRPDLHPAFEVTFLADEDADQILRNFGPIKVKWDGVQRGNMAISWTNLATLSEEQFHELYPRILNSRLWPRASYYNQAKPQIARRIAPHLSKEDLSPRLLEWLGKIVGVIRHQNL